MENPTLPRHCRFSLPALALGASLSLFSLSASAQATATRAFPDSTARDGQHDFDFLFGDWKFHLRRLLRPLTGSTTWVEMDGRATCRPIWGGKANMDEVLVENAEQHTRIEGLTVRMYNPASHQWSLYWSSSTSGTIGLPPTVGHFTNGVGEFYDREEYNGKMILVRYQWSRITPTSAHFEQAFSTDEGKTWETNWITDQTRETPKQAE